MALPKVTYRPDIDGLRALAVASVVIFHASRRALPGGFLGVDVFFVISGYLITSLVLQQLASGTFRLMDFYGRRVRRLFPALIAMMLTVAIAGYFVMLPGELEGLGHQLMAGSTSIANIVEWLEHDYFSSELDPLLHLWSLGVEEQFYLVWPALLLLLVSARKHRAMPLWAGLITLATASLLFSLLLGSHFPQAVFYLPFGRMWELLLGAALAHRCHQTPNWSLGPKWSEVVGWLGPGLLAVSFTMSGPGVLPRLLATLGALAIVSAGPHATFNRYVLRARLLVGLGLISYPLYLWHWPLLAFARLRDGNISTGVILAVVLASVFMAWLTMRWLETPIRHAGAERGRATLAMVLAMMAVGAIGAAFTITSGLPRRLPHALRRTLSARFDATVSYREGDCFLRPEQGPANYGSSCVDPPSVGGPLVALWGDSHSAHLLPGLRAVQRRRPLRIAQFSASLCPPIVELEIPSRPHCQAAREYALQRIAELHPDTVILSALWSFYDRGGLEKTATALRSVPRVVLMGQVPFWEPSMPRSVWMAASVGGGFSGRLHNWRQEDLAIDAELRAAASKFGWAFVSAHDLLCNPDGCLASVKDPGANDWNLVAWDNAHLTEVGSGLLVSAAQDGLLGPVVIR